MMAGVRKRNPRDGMARRVRRRRRAPVVRSYLRRSSFRGLPGLSYLLGAAGAYVGEELEIGTIRPWLDKRLGTSQGAVAGHGAIDLAAGYLLGRFGGRIRGLRSFVRGMSYTLGGKGIGKVKQALTGSATLWRK